MTNAKFEVGEKVRVIGAKGFNDSTSAILEFIGKTAKITNVRKYPDGDIGYCFNNETNGMENYCFDEKSLEKVDETKNWFNIDIRSEGDRTVAYYIDRNGEQKVSVFRYKDDEYDPKVAVDYLMQKVDFGGAKAKIEAKDDDWQCGDLVTYNGEKAEIVAMNHYALMLDFKFELEFTFDATYTASTYYDKEGNVWKADGEKKTYIVVAKNNKDLELVKAVRKVDVKIPEVPKTKPTKPNPKDYPFAIGDRVYVRYLNDYGTVVAYRRGDRTVLAHMDGKNAHYHKGGHFEHRMIDADGNLFKAVKDEYWWVNDTNAEKIEDSSKTEIEFPFEIGDRIYIKNRFSSRINNKAATVVAHDVLDGSCLVKVDVPDYDCFHKGNYGHSCKNIVDENGEPYKFSGKPEYWWITEKRFGELIKDEKPVSAKFNIGDRVKCTYGYSHTVTGYGTVVAYSNNYGLEIGYLVKVDSEYRHDIPCHNGLADFYEPYIAVGKKWINESEEESFRYFGIDDLKKVK